MHTTEQLNAALEGRYALERLVGEGGMATVYLARDLRHMRPVALKVLRPDLGAIVGVERFLSEIRVTANLQHPNLLPLFDSGAADDVLYYVMPYVGGESLRAKLEREKQLPIDEALHIATAVASALDYAHRHGVIHRDLKPENILLHEGEPLVADFGIALAVRNAGGNRITQTGLSLGTPQYMSPEQATGDRTIDARADIYSLGAVTYEMLTGEPPHTGSTSQAIIARVLTERPRRIRSSRPSVPDHVEAAIERALEKLPADRWPTAREFSESMNGARPVPVRTAARESTPDAASVRAPRHAYRLRELTAWALAVGGIATTTFLSTRRNPPPVAVTFPVDLPESVSVATTNGFALSRDGSQLAIAGRLGNGRRAIYLRRLNDVVAAVVRGSDSASFPSFSPDGRSLLFVVGRTLRKVSVLGGVPQTLADSVDTHAQASWEGDNVVYESAGSIWVVSSQGENRRLLAKPDAKRGVARYAQPELLPGGHYALVALSGLDLRIGGSSRSVRLGAISLDDGGVTELDVPGSNPHFAAPGFLVFARAGGIVMAAPFSLGKRTVTGPAVHLVQEIMQSDASVGVTVSQSGMLAYNSDVREVPHAMYAVDRHGIERQLKGSLQLFKEPRVSPDGRHIAVRIGLRNVEGDLWIHDLATGALTRLTSDARNSRGEWSRDGSRVNYVSTKTGGDSQMLVSRPWDGNGAEQILASAAGYGLQEVSLGPSSGYAAIRTGSLPGTRDIVIAPTDSLSATRPFLFSSADEIQPRVSPNGRLLAYMSEESGRFEVYLQPIPGPGPRVPVSVDGGTEPIWSADGGTLFFRGGTRLMSATIVEHPVLAVSRVDSLFLDGYVRNGGHAAYDVFPNGREFLMTKGPPLHGQIYVIVNWTQMIPTKSTAVGER